MKVENNSPGRDLDRLVAEKVMGWIKKIWKDPYDGTIYTYILRYPDQSPKEALKELLPTYSQDASAAAEVVEKMKTSGFNLYIEKTNNLYKPWSAGFYKTDIDRKTLVYGETEEHAICLAALAV